METVPNKGEVLVFETKIPGRPSVKALAEIFPQIIAKLQFPKNMGIDAAHVSYRGSAPADVDLVAGQIQYMTDTINSVMPFDWLTNRDQAPRIFDDACLTFLEMCKPATGATNYAGRFETVAG